MWRTAAATLLLMLASAALAQHHGHRPSAPYAGEQERVIKGLSADDIAELKRGGGWGLAKPAELNGLPGPMHLLEMKDRLSLTVDQVAAIQSVFDAMRRDAIVEGERLIARERALDEAFRRREVTPQSLRRMLEEIEASRAALRYIHLAAHLATPPLLTEAQIAAYNRLRGYGPN